MGFYQEYTKETHECILSVLLKNFGNVKSIDISPFGKRVHNLWKIVDKYYKIMSCTRSKIS